MRTISYLVAFTTDNTRLDRDQLAANIANYLRPIGIDVTVTLDDDRVEGVWEATA